MNCTTETKLELTLEEIEEAIKEFILSRRTDLKENNCKIDFTLKDINVDDDDRGPYRPIYRLNTATATFN